MKKRIMAALMAFAVLMSTNAAAHGAALDDAQSSAQQEPVVLNAGARATGNEIVENNPVVITIDKQGTSAAPAGNLFAFDDDNDKTSTTTYIFKKPVNITVTDSYANSFSLVSENAWDKYIFEDTVTITIKDSDIKTISGAQSPALWYMGNGTEEWNSTQFKKKLTINAENVVFNSLVGGIIKGTTWGWPKIPTLGMQTLMEDGIDINLKDISQGSRSVILGHYLLSDSYELPPTQVQYYVKGASSVNLVNSEVTSIVASKYRTPSDPTNLESVKQFAAISGNVAINLDNQSTVTGDVSGFPTTRATSTIPSVSGRNGSAFEAHLNAAGDLTLKTLGNFTHMKLAKPIHVSTAWQLDNGEHVSVDFQDATKWQDGMDILTLDQNADDVTSAWLQKNWGNTPAGKIDIRSDGAKKTLFIAPNIPPAIVTFKVANGKWADGTMADKTVPVKLTGGSGTLPLGEVPTGMTANPGYDYGVWSATPDTAPNAVKGDTAYTYTFYQNSSDDTNYYTLRFDTNGGSAVSSVTRGEGSALPLTQVTTRNEYRFDGWYQDKALTQKVTSMTLTRDTTVYAKWTKIADDKVHWDRDEHNAYIIGYPDGMLKPAKNIERSEVAMILHSLMTAESRAEFAANTSRFHDLNETMWYFTPAATLENAGILSGYPDGSFGGNRSITRAEFVAIFVRAYGDDVAATGTEKYSDIANSWARESINKASEIGLIFGDTDGRFRPESNITRAEAISIINRFLKRDLVDEKSVLTTMKRWTDNMDTTAWYYYDLQEASNSHDYSRRADNYENWTKLR